MSGEGASGFRVNTGFLWFPAVELPSGAGPGAHGACGQHSGLPWAGARSGTQLRARAHPHPLRWSLSGACALGGSQGRSEGCWVPGAWVLSQEHAGTFFQATGAVHLGKRWSHCAGSRCHRLRERGPSSRSLGAGRRRDCAGASHRLTCGAALLSPGNYLLFGSDTC